jgi:hypothetical protein
VVVPQPSDGADRIGGSFNVVDHPLTQRIDWAAAAQDARVAPPPGSQWQALVMGGEQILVAVRETPVRQVWVGFDSPRWRERGDFVTLFATAFEWVSEGAERFVATMVQDVPQAWQRLETIEGLDAFPPSFLPGLFIDEHDTISAANVTDVRFAPPPVVGDVAPQGLAGRHRRAGVDATPWLLMVSLLLCLCAAATCTAERKRRARSAVAERAMAR